MKQARIPFTGWLALFVAPAGVVFGAELAWVPVDATGPHVIDGRKIILPAGDVRVTLELHVSGWDPDGDGDPRLSAAEGDLDSSGFTGGVAGALSTAHMPCDGDDDCPLGIACGGQVDGRCDESLSVHPAAYVDMDHPTYVFRGVPSIAAVDTSQPDHRFGATTIAAGDSVADSGAGQYLGTLVLYVSPDAEGLFTVALHPGPRSFINDQSYRSIVPLDVQPALIAVGVDCNNNDLDDREDIVSGRSTDCNGNHLPDECEADCNGNGVADECDINGGCTSDCNDNRIPDECESDCNGNGLADECDLADGVSADCNGDGVPDECSPLAQRDCNANEVSDLCDIATGASDDCNGNGVPDECDLSSAVSADCNGNGVPDDCEPDCNDNGIADECDIRDNASLDDDRDGVPDSCVPTFSLVPVSATAGVVVSADEIVVPPGGATVTLEGYISDWDPDMDGDPALRVYQFQIDSAGYSSGERGSLAVAVVPCATDGDCFGPATCSHDTPGLCDVRYDAHPAAYVDTARGDRVFADLPSISVVSVATANFMYGAVALNATQPALDVGSPGYGGTLLLDVSPDAAGTFTVGFVQSEQVSFMFAQAGSQIAPLSFVPARVTIVDDCNENGEPDAEEIAAGSLEDCNGNRLPDSCELAWRDDLDCDGSGVLDACESSEDCNNNGVLDLCDVAGGTSADEDADGVPDECEMAAPTTVTAGGGRYLIVRPAEDDQPVAIRVTSPDQPCLFRYVNLEQGLGRLTDVPTYRRASDWGTVAVADDAIVPDTMYAVVTELTDGVESASVLAVTGIWGDVVPPKGVDFSDIAAIVDDFAGGGCGGPRAESDLFPATPDGVIDFQDIAAAVDAFTGRAYPFSQPCP